MTFQKIPPTTQKSKNIYPESEKLLVKIFLSVHTDFVMKMIKNPLIAACALLASLFYLFHFPVKEYPLKCTIEKEKITNITATLNSTLVKLPSGKFYKAGCSVHSAASKKGMKSEASGKVALLLPKNLVEYYRPYSLLPRLADIPAVIESGERMELEVKFIGEKTFRVLSAKKSGTEVRLLSAIRARIRAVFLSLGEAASLSAALLQGEREYLPLSLSSAFRQAGISHVLALSGMHLSILSLSFHFSLSRLFGCKLSSIISFLAVSLFIVFAPSSPSLFRAFLFYAHSALFSFLFIDVENRKSEIFASSFILHSLIYPSHIFRPAFILSYSAVLGIILSPKITLPSRVKNQLLLNKILSSFCISLFAFLFSSPAVMFYFKTFSPHALLATLFISPLISIFMYTSILSVILSLFFPFLIPFCRLALSFEYFLIVKTVNFFALFPSFHFD